MDLLKFVRVAESIASLSKDPSTKVGALIIDDDANIISTGFNGFPRGVNDMRERYQIREMKLKLVAHAEANAIAQAARAGHRTHGANLIVTALYPCTNCTGLIIQAGIKRVFAPVMDPVEANRFWFQEQRISKMMFEEADVTVIDYDPKKL